MTPWVPSLSTRPIIAWSIIVFATAMLCTLAFTPYVKRIAFACGAVDYPGSRKVHTNPTARWGGIAIAGSLAVALGGLRLLSPDYFATLWASPLQESGLCLGIIVMLLLGVRDDMHCVVPGTKLFFQVCAAVIAYCAGFSISPGLSHPSTLGPAMQIGDGIVTVLWIVGVTNAVNLVDGLDGLASGVGVIACFTIYPFALWNQDRGMAVLTLALAGALLGFLYHNFNPARIFLGDSGSLLVGFLLAILSIKCSAPVRNGAAPLIPLLVMGLPVLDTLLAVVRRLLRSLHSGQSGAKGLLDLLRPIFSPDKSHIHHKLIESGLSHRTAVLLLYAVSCGLGLSALAVAHASPEYAWPIALAFILAIGISVRYLGYKELAVIRNGSLLKVFEYILHRRRYLVLLDGVFVMISLAISCALLTHDEGPTDSLYILFGWAGVAIVQVLVLWISGLYKHTSRCPGLENVYRIFRAIALAVIVTGIVIALVPLHGSGSTPVLLLTDFYFLATLVCLSRYSIRMLTHAFRSPDKGASRVLMYGTGLKARLSLERMLTDTTRAVIPVGFIDDNPDLEGRTVFGYPVFGGHRKLSGSVDTLGVDGIYLVTKELKQEALDRVRDPVRNQRVKLVRFSTRLEEIVSAGGLEMLTIVAHEPVLVSARRLSNSGNTARGPIRETGEQDVMSPPLLAHHDEMMEE